MKEVTFLQRNASNWEQIETSLQKKDTNISADELGDLFIHLSDDLAYAKTYYPKSKTTQYLNELTLKVHQRIYKNKKESTKRWFTFWKFEVPEILYANRRYLLFSFLFFFFSFLIGMFSAANDPTFVNLILGDEYVQMTKTNIKNGDPMAVYKKMSQTEMFLYITFNNVRVSFNTFILGIIASIGTVFILFYNGVMLGSFQYYFYEFGVLKQSLLTIWIHGTLEISAIIIAGAAGLIMGNSILFPGTYARLTSFKNGAIKGLKVVMSLVPIFIVAGFLEGFVTRYTGMPLWLSLFIILGSLFFIIFYFVYYPSTLHKQNLLK